MAYCCLFGGFLALGFILLILGLVKIKTHCEFDMSKEEEDSADRACVVGFWLFVSAIISFVLCSIPLYVKCCCTNPSVDMNWVGFYKKKISNPQMKLYGGPYFFVSRKNFLVGVVSVLQQLVPQSFWQVELHDFRDDC
eukprot:TRINITY_DN21804_c0_g1_i2.p2 TRINITY_DN21804_c0_g1~~TRINITY_DN21804_c0_g1_i2.p2  ORF type:complete len:138 (+),score=5.80 TRINITY_DN21804_c0_g1_i2:82-495(+)